MDDKKIDIDKDILSKETSKKVKKAPKPTTYSVVKDTLNSENITSCRENSSIINNKQCVMSLLSELDFCKECILIGFDPHNSYTCIKDANVKNFGTHRSKSDWGKGSRLKNVQIIEKDFLIYDPSLIENKVQLVVYDYHTTNRYLFNSIKRLIALLDDECVLVFDNSHTLTRLSGYIQGMKLIKETYSTIKALKVNSKSGLEVLYLKK